MASRHELQSSRRKQYLYLMQYRTRWSDHSLSHSIWYHLLDSIVNTYLTEQCGLNPQKSSQIGLVVSSFCEQCFSPPPEFSRTIDLGLCVRKLGSSSVTYQVGIFEEHKSLPSAVLGYTHVFVGSKSRQSEPISSDIRAGLEKLYVPRNRL